MVPRYTDISHFRAPYKNSWVYTGVGAADPVDTKEFEGRKYLASTAAEQSGFLLVSKMTSVVGEATGPKGTKVFAFKVNLSPAAGSSAADLTETHRSAGEAVLARKGAAPGTLELIFTNDIDSVSGITMAPENVAAGDSAWRVLYEPSGGWKSGGTGKLFLYGGAALGVGLLAWALWPKGKLTPNRRRNRRRARRR